MDYRANSPIDHHITIGSIVQIGEFLTGCSAERKHSSTDLHNLKLLELLNGEYRLAEMERISRALSSQIRAVDRRTPKSTKALQVRLSELSAHVRCPGPVSDGSVRRRGHPEPQQAVCQMWPGPQTDRLTGPKENKARLAHSFLEIITQPSRMEPLRG